MKKIVQFLVVTSLIFVASCKKNTEQVIQNSFVKITSSQTQMASAKCFLSSDNQIIVVNRSYDNKTPGFIQKISNTGDEIWRKDILPFNTTLWNAAPVQGGGFITVGLGEETIGILVFNVIKYDDEGNVILTDTVPIPYSVNGCSPAEILQLSNGNFVFGSSHNGQNKGYIIVTNSNFDLLNTETYQDLKPGFNGCYIKGLEQLNDTSIAFTASVTKLLGNAAITNSMLITADLNGERRTVTFLEDSLQSETTNYLGINNNGMLSITSSMKGWNIGQGLHVNYLGNSVALFISGRINFIQYDLNGNFRNRKKVYSYSGNGLIFSAKKTKDGGFILCGTVNQNDNLTIDANTQIYLMKLDAEFNTQWFKSIFTVYPSYGSDIVETIDRGFFISGHQYTNNSNFNIIAIKTDSNGNFENENGQ